MTCVIGVGSYLSNRETRTCEVKRQARSEVLGLGLSYGEVEELLMHCQWGSWHHFADSSFVLFNHRTSFRSKLVLDPRPI